MPSAHNAHSSSVGDYTRQKEGGYKQIMDVDLFEQQIQIGMVNELYERGVIDTYQRDEVCRLIIQSFEKSNSRNERSTAHAQTDPSTDSIHTQS